MTDADNMLMLQAIKGQGRHPHASPRNARLCRK
jgi:hypothetical protein